MPAIAPFTLPRYTSFYQVQDPHVYSVANFISNLNDPVNVRNGLNNAFAQVKATGGTLNFTPNQVYVIDDQLNLDDASDFALMGNNATIKARDGMGTKSAMFRVDNCSNFHWDRLKFDGNRNNRVGIVESAHGLFFAGINCPAIGGGRASLNKVTSTMIPNSDGIRFQDSVQGSAQRRLQNMLIYECDFSHCYRLNVFIRTGYNIQYIGGFNTNAGQIVAGGPSNPPNSGMDLEAEVGDADPAVEQILIEGITWHYNQRSCIQIAAKVATIGITIKGNKFIGEAPFANPQIIARGSAIVLGSSETSIEDNSFELFDTSYNKLPSIVEYQLSVVGPPATNTSILRNWFNNNSQAKPCIHMIPLSDPDFPGMGGGHLIQGNRAFNCVGDLISPASQSGYTLIDNLDDRSAAGTPSPTTPAYAKIPAGGGGNGGGGGFPGGAIEFDAFSQPGAEFTTTGTFTHTPVAPPKSATVMIVQRGSGVDEILTAAYGSKALGRVSPGFAADVAGEVGAAYIYHAGSGLPTGPQTVTITTAAGRTGTYRAVCATHTADGDTAIHVAAIAEGDMANPSLLLPLAAGLECSILGCLFSGQPAVSVAPGASYTEIAEYDLAASRAISFIRRTADPTGGNISADWVIAASDDVAAVAVAISSIATNPIITMRPTGIKRLPKMGSPNIKLTNPVVIRSIQTGIKRLPKMGAPQVQIIGPVTPDTPGPSSIVSRRRRRG